MKANVGSAQSALEPVEAARGKLLFETSSGLDQIVLWLTRFAGSINPFQDEFGEDDRDPPPYESHRNDRLVPQ